jgi:nucleoid DNA-binding protein
MAKRINAIKALMPQIELNKTIQIDELADYISRGTNLNPAQIKYVLDELSDALLFFTSSGQPVKLDGLGTFTPAIRLSGEYTINVRVERELINGLNAPDAFKGRIKNKTSIGKASGDLVAEWNEAHPEDPVID